MFEALKGRGYAGDIALDDITITNGACPPPGKILYFIIFTLKLKKYAWYFPAIFFFKGEFFFDFLDILSCT